MRLPTLFLTAIVAYLCSALYPSVLLDWLIAIVSLLIVFTVFRFAKRFVQVLGSLMLAIGIALLVLYGAPLPSYILCFGRMLNILSLFAFIPLIVIPIELGRYAVRVQAIIQQNVKHSGLLYAITSFMAFISSSFMNLAALPMVYQTMRPSVELFPISEKERFLSRSITHGFSMPTMWTPVTPIVGIVVEMTRVKWSHILPIVIPFSLLCVVVDCLMAFAVAKRRQKQLAQSLISEMAAARECTGAAEARLTAAEKAGHPVQILAAILIFNGLISVLESSAHVGFLLVVTLIVIPYAFLWSLLLGQGRAFIHSAKKKLPEQLLHMKDQFFIFLSAGYMISAVQSTGAGHVVNESLAMVKNAVGADVFILLIPLIPFTLAFLGLQPAVALALTAESMNPQALGVSVELMAIAMLTGAASAFLMGPYNATVAMMASLTKKSSYKLSRWNAPFTMTFLLMSMLLLIILKIMG
ncbi:hypothetical protein [Brevibacillus massiliensis]|uniref:hypothetical protein n=1 Tax=Brevibacillus massiliensis TaxID=1118054 RepID=UPI0002DB8B3A|nr:hypothetical protein [Brevibacillus massiliensis]